MTEGKQIETLDDVLVEVGDFGKYQILVFSLVSFAVVLHSAVHVAYVFTALNVDHRCALPECDTDPPIYEPNWLPNGVPYSGRDPLSCQRYFYNSSGGLNESCNLADYDSTRTISCDSFVYKTKEYSILQEYNLQCQENLWKLSMVGTINSVGQFVGLFIGGVISDKYGRRVILVWGMVICAMCGLIKVFMPTYEWFLVLEFLDATFGASTYICGFVLGVELVSPKYRVMTGIIASSCYAVGEVFTAAAAWLVQSWKPLTLILYTPPLFLIAYLWIVPESVRWSLSKGRLEEAKATLRIAAKFNGKELSESTLEKLALIENDESTGRGSLKAAFSSTILTLRLINCCFCWITCAFLFYGLTLNSVSLAAGNSYVDFILTSLIEIPAYICCHFMLDLMGRKKSVIASFLITGISCLAFIFVSQDSHTASLSLYLLGKFGATAAFTNIYVITSEMFPTNMRHSFMGTCSTFGRIGSMVSPQTPLLSQLWQPLPLVSFASMSFVAALLTCLFPETQNIKLPDTIEEAENLSKNTKRRKAHQIDKGIEKF